MQRQTRNISINILIIQITWGWGWPREKKNTNWAQTWETSKGWETGGREQRFSRPSLLSRLNNACCTVLVTTEVRRRESLVELPCSRNPGSQMVGKADRKKLRQNRVKAGGDAEVCSLLLACLHWPRAWHKPEWSWAVGFWHMLSFLKKGRLWYTYLLQ